MKRVLMFVLMVAVSLWADELKAGAPAPSEVLHVATALDHLTVLEFGEPVTMAAAGSTAFQIERHEDKVFIKPLKTGASTDLFVWTASRRFIYELETPGEVTQMNFAIDSRLPAQKPVPDTMPRLEDIADMVLTRALLGAERVDSSSVKEQKDGITVRVKQVFESRNTTYVHYLIRNSGMHPYRVPAPTVEQLLPLRDAVSIHALRLQQLNSAMTAKLGKSKREPLEVAHAETQKTDLATGEETHGVIAIRQKIDRPAVVEVVFGTDGNGSIKATLVF